jgi:hypothetical protein
MHGALRTAQEYRLTDAAYRRLYRDAYAVGLDRAKRIDTPAVLDAPTLTVSLRVDGALRTTVVTVPDRDDPQRTAIAAFRQRLKPSSWPAGNLTAGPLDYRPGAIAVIATWLGSTATSRAERPWPLASLLTGTHVDGGECSLYTGAQLPEVSQVASANTPATHWSSGGSVYLTSFRPLLPGESGCVQLDR